MIEVPHIIRNEKVSGSIPLGPPSPREIGTFCPSQASLPYEFSGHSTSNSSSPPGGSPGGDTQQQWHWPSWCLRECARLSLAIVRWPTDQLTRNFCDFPHSYLRSRSTTSVVGQRSRDAQYAARHCCLHTRWDCHAPVACPGAFRPAAPLRIHRLAPARHGDEKSL